MEEILYPLPSVKCFINEDLIIYKSKKGKPDINSFSHLGCLASKWVNEISGNDDSLISDLIYWKEREYTN